MDMTEIDLTGSDSTEYPYSPKRFGQKPEHESNVAMNNCDWSETLDTLAGCFHNNNGESYDPGVVLGTDRKRCRRAMFDEAAIDDIMGQINEKLTFNQSEQLQRSNRIDAFIEVLGCSRMEAEFYLESSRWNVETAVILWLENNPHPRTSFPSFFPDIFPGYNETVSKTAKPKYIEREVVIEGLPNGWYAKIDPFDGHIYFQNATTGYRQTNVPPGFADNNDTSTASSSSTRSSSYSSASAAAPSDEATATGGLSWGENSFSTETCYEEMNGFLVVKERNEDLMHQSRKIDNTPAWMNEVGEGGGGGGGAAPASNEKKNTLDSFQFDISTFVHGAATTSFSQIAQSILPVTSSSHLEPRSVSWEDDPRTRNPWAANTNKLNISTIQKEPTTVEGAEEDEEDEEDEKVGRKKRMPWGTPREKTGLSSGMDDDDENNENEEERESELTSTILPPPQDQYISSSSSSSSSTAGHPPNEQTQTLHGVGVPPPTIMHTQPCIFQYSSSASASQLEHNLNNTSSSSTSSTATSSNTSFVSSITNQTSSNPKTFDVHGNYFHEPKPPVNPSPPTLSCSSSLSCASTSSLSSSSSSSGIPPFAIHPHQLPPTSDYSFGSASFSPTNSKTQESMMSSTNPINPPIVWQPATTTTPAAPTSSTPFQTTHGNVNHSEYWHMG